MNEKVQSVGILGGGTAGYLTALALRRHFPGVDITLIESSAVPVIGVGEATTPLMPQFLHVDLGLDMAQFFRQVRPSLKLGIRFDWGDSASGFFHYPFGPLSLADSLAHDGHMLNCSFRSMLMSASRVLVSISRSGEVINGLDAMVAYHLENRRFVAYLKARALESGVNRADCRIVEVQLDGKKGAVAALQGEDGRSFQFDLYIDCSGFRSLLMRNALRSDFICYEGSLFTDSAWVAAVPHGGEMRPYTAAETMDAGWCWTTPLPEEDHCGYVFSSSFLSADQAVAEMKRHLPLMSAPRLIRFRPGRLAHFWKGNVVALGNAYAFVEPLESTALHMLIRQIGVLLGGLRSLRLGPELKDAANTRVAGWWDYLCWFLALHFKYNRRLSTPFWTACAQEVDVLRHGELIEAFRRQGTLSNGFSAGPYPYPDPLWGPHGVEVMLRGQGVAAPAAEPQTEARDWRRWVRKCSQVVNRSETQSAALACLSRRPELLSQWAARFHEVGPAFPVG